MRVGKGTPLRLPTKTKAKALDRYKTFLQRSLSCVTTAVWYTADAPRGEKGEFVLLTSEAPLTLKRAAEPAAYFTATQNFHLERDHRFTGEWKVKTDRYEYSVNLSASMDPELLAWHWHPGSKPDPHIHARLDGPGASLHKMHVPTGRVSFEAVIRFLVEDLGAEPARKDWKEVLADAEGRFKKYQTWR